VGSEPGLVWSIAAASLIAMFMILRWRRRLV
jgi:MYXO-CTERM domain-containing protein